MCQVASKKLLMAFHNLTVSQIIYVWQAWASKIPCNPRRTFAPSGSNKNPHLHSYLSRLVPLPVGTSVALRKTADRDVLWLVRTRSMLFDGSNFVSKSRADSWYATRFVHPKTRQQQQRLRACSLPRSIFDENGHAEEKLDENKISLSRNPQS